MSKHTIICSTTNSKEVRYSNSKGGLPAGSQYLVALERTGNREQYASIIVSDGFRAEWEVFVSQCRIKQDESFVRAEGLPAAYMYKAESARAIVNTVDAGLVRYVTQDVFANVPMPEVGDIDSKPVAFGEAIATYAWPSRGGVRTESPEGAKKPGTPRKLVASGWRQFVDVENLGTQLISQYTKVIAMTQKSWPAGTMADALKSVVISGVTPTGEQQTVADKYRPWLKVESVNEVMPGSLYVLSFVPGENPALAAKKADAAALKPIEVQRDAERAKQDEMAKSYMDNLAAEKLAYEERCKVIQGAMDADRKVVAAKKKVADLDAKLAELESAFNAKYMAAK